MPRVFPRHSLIFYYNIFMKKTGILFVCHGNICRSPMAERIMKHMVREARLEESFYIESAAATSEETGNGIYPPARRKLNEHGINAEGHSARLMTRADYSRFDLLIGMDNENIYDMRHICGGDPEGKIHMLMEYTGSIREVADPWYTGDFEATWCDLLEGCRKLLEIYGGKDGSN